MVCIYYCIPYIGELNNCIEIYINIYIHIYRNIYINRVFKMILSVSLSVDVYFFSQTKLYLLSVGGNFVWLIFSFLFFSNTFVPSSYFILPACVALYAVFSFVVRIVLQSLANCSCEVGIVPRVVALSSLPLLPLTDQTGCFSLISLVGASRRSSAFSAVL